MSTIDNFDLNELLLHLHQELRYAFDAAASTEAAAAMQLQEVKARMGRKEIEESTDNKNILDPERYPDEEDWEIELTYNKTNMAIRGAAENLSFGQNPSRALIDNLAETPIVHIKGISNVWQQRFYELNIRTIKDLENTDESILLTMSNEYNTSKPFEFQTKVLLLIRSFPILTRKDILQHKIEILLENSGDTIKRILNNKLSSPEIEGLRNITKILFIVFDRSFLEDLKLNIFYKD